ncbi:MAG: lactate utilization protein [Bacillota bacterium]
MNPVEEYYQTRAENVIAEFEKRNIEGYYCASQKEAVAKALDLAEDDSSVAWGGSMTIRDIGLVEQLKETNYEVFDRATAETEAEVNEIYHQALGADYYFMSSNAITLDGKLVNIDGRGNRIAALIYGPQNVIVIAGMNKVVADEEAAEKRVRNHAAAINAIRLDQDTPCAKTGECHNCLVNDCICCQKLITRNSRQPGRIKVILVGEELGY